ncbi:MAG: ABC transporter permease [Myxococcales bacterium]|nr:ABC transporter permease [Myxococcales bacterium]
MKARDSWLRRLPYWVGGGVLLLMLVAAVFAPWLAPFPVEQVDLVNELAPPDAVHWLGTDENGADLLTQILYGARVAALVGLSTVLLCATVGVVLGAISGYYGGLVDELMMRVIDVLMAFPGILLAILIIALTRSPSIWAVVLALSVTGWAGYARLVRGQVFSLRERPFVLAARAMGAPGWWIIGRHLLPNVMAPVIVQATFGVAGAILAEAGLSFLGLGPDGVPSWGALLDQGARYFLVTGHLALFPGLAIAAVVMGINLLGDALRDTLDPHGTPR